MMEIVPCRLSKPLYLQAGINAGKARMISLREHLSVQPENNPHLPLVLVTFHPGYSAGSYDNRDYFEKLTPLLFSAGRGRYRLRIFTVNHPGHDLPPGSKIERFETGQFSIKEQPALIRPALRWLLQRECAAEEALTLVAHGHSMGGLALARANLQPLVQELARKGRRLQVEKVLSAPALFLHSEPRRFLRPLDALHVLKHSLGRLPLYDQIAKAIYRALAQPLHRLRAGAYSLNPDDTFLNFHRRDPFLLLQQGRELLQHDCRSEELPDLLGGTHLLLYQNDKMVDNKALLQAAQTVQGKGVPVHVHRLKGPHSAERENPEVVVPTLHEIILRQCYPAHS